MITFAEWKTRFETFLAEVPLEKKTAPGGSLKWTQRHEQIVCMYYGIGQAEQTIAQIGDHFYVVDNRIKHLLHQARRMYNRYHETKVKNDAILARRARLAEEIKSARM